MTPEAQTAFMAAIASFSQRLKRPEAWPILDGWDPTIVLVETESQRRLVLAIKGADLAGVAEGDAASTGDIVVEGDAATLLAIFDGSVSAAEAFFDERIAIVAEPEDQLKLDALSYIIWSDD